MMTDVAIIINCPMVNQDSVRQQQMQMKKVLVALVMDGVEIVMLIASAQHV